MSTIILFNMDRRTAGSIDPGQSPLRHFGRRRTLIDALTRPLPSARSYASFAMARATANASGKVSVLSEAVREGNAEKKSREDDVRNRAADDERGCEPLMAVGEAEGRTVA